MAQAEIGPFIEKSHLDISEKQYAHFKYSEGHYLTQLQEAMSAFGSKGESEKISINHLSDLFGKYDQ